MVTADYGSTDLKDLEAIKPHKKEKRPPTSSLIVVLLQGVMQVGGFTAIIPTAAMYVEAVGGWLVAIDAAAILYILLLWNRLTVPKENNSSESTHVPA